MIELTHCGEGTLIVLWVSTAIIAAVFGLMVYSIIRFSKSPPPSSVQFVHRTAAEVVWAIIPILILVITAAPAVKTLVGANNGCVAKSADFR